MDEHSPPVNLNIVLLEYLVHDFEWTAKKKIQLVYFFKNSLLTLQRKEISLKSLITAIIFLFQSVLFISSKKKKKKKKIQRKPRWKNQAPDRWKHLLKITWRFHPRYTCPLAHPPWRTKTSQLIFAESVVTSTAPWTAKAKFLNLLNLSSLREGVLWRTTKP